jgi:hypothetical protein
MVISVLERRAEIGLRRSFGATRGQIRLQFLAESLLLSALGGVGGAVLGIVVTTLYATTQSWSPVVPAWATAGGVAATFGHRRDRRSVPGDPRGPPRSHRSPRRTVTIRVNSSARYPEAAPTFAADGWVAHSHTERRHTPPARGGDAPVPTVNGMIQTRPD